MRYQSEGAFRHDEPATLGVLVVNLGTPASPAVADVRRYLAQFLSDPRVIEMPRALWWPILHGVILRTRPRRSARAYEKIWGEEGSPLLAISRRQAAALQQALDGQGLGPVRVELGMCYGTPSLSASLAALRRAGARRMLVLPMYPQYSSTTTGAVFDRVTAELCSWRWVPELRFINQYHDHPGYISALTDSIRRQWVAHGEPKQLLLSFHGIPKDYFLAGDPYYCQCRKTARLVTEGLGLAEGRWQVAFQSRVGRKEWLKPYTDHVLQEWGRARTERVDVVCPGFSADCLETLEEIAEENRDRFIAAGGGEYRYISALNAEPAHISALAELVARHAAGWPEAQPEEGAARLARARRLDAPA
jgi:protoporphyrin/coproporphyrin ferrochelatase